jgi:hypothetical protein
MQHTVRVRERERVHCFKFLLDLSRFQRLLTMVCTTQDYWVFGHEGGNKFSFQNIVFFRVPDDGQSPKSSNPK